MRKAFKYRCYPTRLQEAVLVALLETHRRLYNRALAERKDAYEQERRTVRYGEQSGQLKEDRKSNPYLGQTNFSSCQATLRRLDRAFTAFFRRLKAGEKPGYPRFRGAGRFDSVEFPKYGDGCRLKQGRAEFQHIGPLKLKLHRPIEGTIKTMTVRREAGKWYVICSCDLGDVQPEPAVGPAVGIDLGCKAFLVTSDGEQVAPPKRYRPAHAHLRRAARRVARRTKGGKRRRKAVRLLARAHQHVANQRRDFHHQTARKLVAAHGLIAVEALQTANLVRRPAPILGVDAETGAEVYLPNGAAAKTGLNKSISDAGWAAFLAILTHKAASAGVVMVAVHPAHTTQACSGCGAVPAVPLTLADRLHTCACGLRLDRDLNAAKNILSRALGRSVQAPTWPERAGVA